MLYWAGCLRRQASVSQSIFNLRKPKVNCNMTVVPKSHARCVPLTNVALHTTTYIVVVLLLYCRLLYPLSGKEKLRMRAKAKKVQIYNSRTCFSTFWRYLSSPHTHALTQKQDRIGRVKFTYPEEQVEDKHEIFQTLNSPSNSHAEEPVTSVPKRRSWNVQ